MRKRSSFGRSRGGKFNPADVLPIWGTVHQSAANAVFESWMLGWGVYDVPSYFRQLRAWIAITTVTGACIGAANCGFAGFFIGAVLGLAGPAVLTWITVMVLGALLFAAIYMIAWAATLSSSHSAQ